MEVNISSILSREASEKSIAFDQKMNSLPLDELNAWEDFEELCLKIFLNEFENVENAQAFRYGSLGHEQAGLDIILLDLSDQKYHVAQCKKIKKVIPSDITSWVNKFLDGDKASETKTFVLMTTFPVTDNPKLVDRWHQETKKLKENGIVGSLFDNSVLLEKLRSMPKTVERFFERSAVERFCDFEPEVNEFPSEFRIRNRVAFNNFRSYENRSARLEVYVPDTKRLGLSACFTFARSDLSGFSVTVDGKYLIELMQYRAHSSSICDGSRFLRVSDNDRYLFSLPTARLLLSEDELLELDWIIVHAWSDYREVTYTLESSWRTNRFPRIKEKEFSFKICNVKRRFWGCIRSYIHAHDYDNGETDDHIFDAADCIKIFVKDRRANLEPGYHLIMYAYPENEMYSSSMLLTWEMRYVNGSNPDNQRMWDAEKVHFWLFNDFFPKVYNWTIAREKKSYCENLLGFSFGSLIFWRRKREYLELSDFVFSYARTCSRNVGERITSNHEFRNVVNELQNHFHVYPSDVPLEDNLILCVVKVCKMLSEHRPIFDDSWIRGNFYLGSGDLINEYDELINEIKSTGKYSTNLDFALRSLVGIARDVKISTAELELASELLKPVWQRYIEDRVCWSYY